jgi:serine/threonine protein kinase
MPLSAGTRVGPYEIVSLLGAGGMGEVYRARDAHLNRDVAIKVLPESVAADPDRLARFVREAQTLGALNHPNIAQLYGFEASATALIMELVPGDDLSVLMARGPIPVADALPIARQLADALEAAHDQGIVHRDLKPANIKLRADGAVKVLDFGLAKALTPDTMGATSDAMNSPTLTARATQLGMILGTAAYMSPEQAKGKAVDKRADIWAFGGVLYEMLSGRRAFDGEDVSTTMAAVLMKDPDWSALPASTPAALRKLIHRCLDRDPKLRLRDIGEARILLNDADALNDRPGTATGAPQSSRAPLLPWIVAGIAGLAAVGLAVRQFSAGDSGPDAAISFNVAPPPNVRPMSNGTDGHGGAISPDGVHFVFSGVDSRTGQFRLYLRRLDSVSATPIPGTEGGLYAFWAPTSRSVAFFAQGKLKRIDIDGNAVQDICDAPTGGWGGAWSRDDVIVAGINDPGPLSRVSARGGKPELVTALGPNEEDHDFPQFLRDGRHFVYTSWGTDAIGQGAVSVGSIDGGAPVPLLRDLLDPAAYSEPGQLLFVRNGTLMAQEFDEETLQLKGGPVAVLNPARGPLYASQTGALSYVTRPPLAERRLVWVSRNGTEQGEVMPAGFHSDTAVSPDGSRVAFAKKESATSNADIWIREVGTGAERRLTFDPGDDRSPVWSPDGQEIIFSSSRQGILGLYRKAADGAGSEKLILEKSGVSALPVSQWHPTAGLIYHGGLPSWDVLALSLVDGKSRTLVGTSTSEVHGAVSPDARWLAYSARESARPEVFLTTYPPSTGKWMATTAGGTEPRWSKDGKELYYISAVTSALMAVDVTVSGGAAGGTPSFGAPRRIHPGPLDWGWFSTRTYDVDTKNGRFLVGLTTAPGELTVVLNWRALLKK